MVNNKQQTRFGFYFYPDALHYRESDLHIWLPHLNSLGASWLTLLAPSDRAIPETFIRQIIQAGIQPVLHMPLTLSGTNRLNDLGILFDAYAHWGVNYVALFDRPNLMKSWSTSNWSKANLVERFLDIFLPVALQALKAGLNPVLPPLEPGGDYWDTAFLFAALQGLQRRGQQELLDNLIVSALAWSGNRSPNWGAGGPERWPRTRPYLTPQNSEDHLGFRIFDWYLSTIQAAIGKLRPIILLAAGSHIGDKLDPRSPAVDVHAHAFQNMTLVKMMSGQSQEFDPVPPEVLTCNFWLLSATQGSAEEGNAWYKPDHTQLPVVNLLKEWVANGQAGSSTQSKAISFSPSNIYNPHPISHYLLLPSREFGGVDYQIETIRPFINKFQPTIGFSPVEASHAKKVTVINNQMSIPESIIDGLLAAGCIVEQISGDGMNIASKHVS